MPEMEALQTLHRYTRASLVTTVPVVGLAPLLVTIANGVRWPHFAVLLVGTAVILVPHWQRVRKAVAAPMAVPLVRPSVGTLVLAVGVLCFGFLWGDPGNVLWAFLPATALAELQFGPRPRVDPRLTAVLALGIGALVAFLAGGLPDRPAYYPLVTGCIAVFVLVALPFGELVALRQWRLAVELDQARRDAAELGATRERLRFAEDLHDILGHALEVVSLKSELASRLASADPDRARTEMVEVQRLARGALTDVRELARGRRPTDLDTELAGARRLLTSAGIDCVVDGAPEADRHSALLGRVLREAVTNLLRHADTERCWITVGAGALSVVNDGVPAEPQVTGDGTGLASLTRKVAEAGGRLTAGPGERQGTFVVSAVLP